MNTCDMCKFWEQFVFEGRIIEGEHSCSNPKIIDDTSSNAFPRVLTDQLVACSCDYRPATINTGPKFGCIHWESKQ